MSRSLVRMILPLLVAVSALTLAEPMGATRAVGRTGAAQTSVLVVSANVREGSRVIRPADRRDGDDRRAFARRVLGRGVGVPDVVLLQEALGTATAFARTFNRHPRAKRLGARYAVVVPPDSRTARGSCDGPRGRHRVIRDGAILVNRTTVARVLNRGFVRTWGRWMRAPGLPTRACAEQAWVLVQLRHAIRGHNRARIANVHAAPRGNALRNRAVGKVAHTLTAVHRRTPRAMLVIGGDFNLTRCQGPARAPERRACAIRVGHRQLLHQGLRDAVRSERPSAVVGVRGRIDFIYSQDPVRSASWDRCYLAFRTTRPGCSPAVARFPVQRVFAACQRRADRVGSPGGTCGPRRYARYYSDHPILRARLAWR